MVSVTTPYLKDINLPLVISCLCSCLQELDCHILPAKYSVESFCLFPQVNICSWRRRRRKTCGESSVALEILHERWSTKKTWELLVPTPSHYMPRVFKQELGGGGRDGEEMIWEFLVEMCRPVLQLLTPFQTKNCRFPHPFSDHSPVVQTLSSG